MRESGWTQMLDLFVTALISSGFNTISKMYLYSIPVLPLLFVLDIKYSLTIDEELLSLFPRKQWKHYIKFHKQFMKFVSIYLLSYHLLVK